MSASRTLIVLGALAAPALFATALSAQDSNTLNRHLEQQQWQRLQDHQNQSRQMDARDRDTSQAARRTPPQACSADALPAADRRRLEAEYVRRVRSDGRASADAWVREQGQRFRLTLEARGVCPESAGGTQTARRPSSERDSEGCQMTVQPVAGFGGASMTMAMVPDCGDED